MKSRLRISLNGDAKPKANGAATLPTDPGDRKSRAKAALHSRRETVNRQWHDAEEQLKEFGFHSPVAVIVDSYVDSARPELGDSVHECLGFFKLPAGWRICTAVTDSTMQDEGGYRSITPISDCSMGVRLGMIPHFSKLQEKIIKEAELAISQFDAAIADFNSVLETNRTPDSPSIQSLLELIDGSANFAAMSKKDRKNAARCLAYAVRMLRYRAEGRKDAFAARKVHADDADSLEFIARHPRLLDALKHIVSENKSDSKEDKGRIGRYLSPGYATAMLYLMGSAKTNRESYAKTRSEQSIDWFLWDKACEFWKMLGEDDPTFSAVRLAFDKILADDGGSVGERCALIVKAWACIAIGTNVTPKLMELEYHTDDDGVRTLVAPTIGGIDLGVPTD